MPRQRNIRGTAASVHLDAARAIAALAVVYSHARVLLMEGSPDGALSLADRLLTIAARYGHSAVMVFFVLSGYLVGGSVVRALENGSWSWREYLIARGSRLYVVLVPALIITVIADHLSLAATAGLPAQSQTANAIITSTAIAANSGWRPLLGNLFYLQEVLVPSLGSNTALWSLSYEFWYYIMFPFLWLAVKGGCGAGRRAVYALVAVGLLWFVGPHISILFTTWLLGVLLVFIPVPDTRSRANLVAWTGIAAVPFALVLGMVGLRRIPPGLPLEFATAIVFAPFMYALLRFRAPMRMGLYARASILLAGCSYTLYATHLPLLILLRAHLTYEQGWPCTTGSWLKTAAICAGAVVLAYFLSLLTEARTGTLRNWLRTLLCRSIERQPPATGSRP